MFSLFRSFLVPEPRSINYLGKETEEEEEEGLKKRRGDRPAKKPNLAKKGSSGSRSRVFIPSFRSIPTVYKIANIRQRSLILAQNGKFYKLIYKKR